jgi:hypothetical protein
MMFCKSLRVSMISASLVMAADVLAESSYGGYVPGRCRGRGYESVGT